jgi:hypothetical protein
MSASSIATTSAATAATTTTTAVSSPAAAATTAAIPAAATAATAALFARPGHIHREISSLKFLSVKHLNGFVCFFVRAHFDEAKPSSFTRHSILHHINGNHSPRLSKEFLKLIFKNLE